MTEKEIKQIQIINNFIMYCRGFGDKKFTEQELFQAIEDIYDLIQKQQEENTSLKADLEKKNKIIDEAKNYCEQIMTYEEYEKKHSKLFRELVRIKEGLTTHYKMWRVANNINNILKRK